MKRTIYIFTPILIVSVLINIFLCTFSLKIYRQYKKVRIDPSGSLEYRLFNSYAGSKSTARKRIVLFGDSRIYQWFPLPDIEGCEIINRGLPGETSAQSLLRIENDLIMLKPDIAIIQIGGNDCNSIGALPEMENYITDNCIQNISVIIEKIRNNKIKAIILSIFPYGTVYPYRLPLWSDMVIYSRIVVNKKIMEYNSDETRILDCDKVFLDNSNKLKRDYSCGLLHMNQNGYNKLNDFIEPVIKELVEKTR